MTIRRIAGYLVLFACVVGVSLAADNVQANFVPGDFGPAAEKLGIQQENGYYDLGQMLNAAVERIGTLAGVVAEQARGYDELVQSLRALQERVILLEAQKVPDHLSLSIVEAPTAVDRGNYTSITIRTAPCATCAIDVILPSGHHSTASGLGVKSADESGVATWTWLVSGNTGGGAATATIACSSSCETQTTMWQFRIVE